MTAKKTNQIDKFIGDILQSLDKRSFWQKDKILLLKEFSYLLKWGVSLNDASKILQESTDNFALKDMAKTIQIYLQKGLSFSWSLSRLPDFFDEGDISIMKAWEESWRLPEVLASLAQEYEYNNEIKNKYIGAMIYPVILLIVAIIAVISLFSMILPSIFSIADGFEGLDLPWTTEMLRNMTNFLQGNWQSIVRTVIGLWAVIGILSSTDKGKKIWFDIILQIPLIGKMTQYYYVVKFCRYMKMMNSSGISYVKTFQLLKDILAIPIYKDMLDNLVAGLKEGKDIYSLIKTETTLIPPDVAIMIKVGEQTANLEQSLTNVLAMYENELDVSINRLSKVIEPIMLIWIWWVVVIIAYAVFGLILQIMEWTWM
jgi:type II secretory pathway component PulF